MKKSTHQTKVAASIMISIIRLHTNFVTNANIATGLKTLEIWFGKKISNQLHLRGAYLIDQD